MIVLFFFDILISFINISKIRIFISYVKRLVPIYYNIIIIYLVITYAHELYIKHHTRIMMNNLTSMNINEIHKCELAYRL